MERRLAAILAADVAGFSTLMERDEEGTYARVGTLRREVIEPRLSEHKGRLIKTTGDGFLAEFASPMDALRCALAIQHSLTDDPGALRLRIGLNLGDVIIEEGGDVYGEGVNVAARLEGLSDPGGILVSAKIVGEVEGKLAAEFEDRGEQQVKNLTRPVRVYSVRSSSAKASTVMRPSLETSPSLRLPDRPSIAVLPFQNMSGDPEQEYFADGVVEDIITALSRFTAFFVIARNSSFTYKGKAVDIRQVGRELGVRYVLEGSIRKSGSRVRISGQLIEAETGRHVWADRFEGELADLFDLQDSVTESVVAAMEPRMLAAEIERTRRKPPANLDAYDYYLRATSEMNKLSIGNLSEALRLYLKSIEMDPEFASPYGLAAFSFVLRKNLGGLRSIKATEVAEAERLAKLAGKLGQHDGVALSHAGHALGYVVLDVENALALTDRAIAINKNLSAAWRCSGWINVYMGQADTAIEHAERAIRLSPIDPYMAGILGIGGMGHLLAGRYLRAIEWAQRGVSLIPNHLTCQRILAASHALVGNTAEARIAVENLRAYDPNLSLADVKHLVPLRRKEDQDRYIEGLRLAGLPG